MKRIVSILLMMMCFATGFAQKDVTTFLGIPVDGTKAAMRQKLIAKGFKPSVVRGKEDCLTGEFNGSDVNVYIVTNNNKVYRIMVADANTCDEGDIKIRFNRLISQFKKNKRYISLNDYTISDEEDISYEMSVHAKNYDAIFYQVPNMEKMDTLAIQKQVRNELIKKFTPEQLDNPTEEITQEAQSIAVSLGMDMIFKKPVWFRIVNYYGKYYIVMYYDNEYNHADGEDL